MLVSTIKEEIARAREGAETQEHCEKNARRMQSIIITWQTEIGSFLHFVVFRETVELQICANSLWKNKRKP